MLSLVDLNNLAHRTYHALGGRVDDPDTAFELYERMATFYGINGGGLHLHVHCYDSGPSFRRAIWEGYKSRGSSGEVSRFVTEIVSLLQARGELLAGIRGYEADDVIASYCYQRPAGVPIQIISTDKDLLALAGPMVRVLRSTGHSFFNGTMYTPREVRVEQGVWPWQYRDYRALVGDPSDTIPGVKGIGVKTAARLIGKYRGLLKLYDSLDELPASTREKLQEGREMAWLSYRLLGLETGLPVPYLGMIREEHRHENEQR